MLWIYLQWNQPILERYFESFTRQGSLSYDSTCNSRYSILIPSLAGLWCLTSISNKREGLSYALNLQLSCCFYHCPNWTVCIEKLGWDNVVIWEVSKGTTDCQTLAVLKSIDDVNQAYWIEQTTPFKIHPSPLLHQWHPFKTYKVQWRL